MQILDATAGPKGIWYQKNHPFVTFMDKRNGTFHNVMSENVKFKTRRRYKIYPDVVSEWKDAPFPDNYFDMIVFDPPHLLVGKDKKPPNMTQKYGMLDKETWRNDLRIGLKKLFSILKPNGIFVLKWCENDISIEEVLKLFPYPPLFGSNIKKKVSTTYWILFIKYDVNEKLIV